MKWGFFDSSPAGFTRYLGGSQGLCFVRDGVGVLGVFSGREWCERGCAMIRGGRGRFGSDRGEAAELRQRSPDDGNGLYGGQRVRSGF